MRKALHGFWRGGLLGGLLGLLVGEGFAIGFYLYASLPYLIKEGFSELSAEVAVFGLFQIFIAVPALVLGSAFGATIGYFFIFLDWWKTWQRMVGLVISASLFHLLVAEVLHLEIFFSIGKYIGFSELDQIWLFVLWPIYLLSAILYGYYFPTFKPRWPKFLRKKQPQTE